MTNVLSQVNDLFPMIYWLSTISYTRKKSYERMFVMGCLGWSVGWICIHAYTTETWNSRLWNGRSKLDSNTQPHTHVSCNNVNCKQLSDLNLLTKDEFHCNNHFYPQRLSLPKFSFPSVVSYRFKVRKNRPRRHCREWERKCCTFMRRSYVTCFTQCINRWSEHSQNGDKTTMQILATAHKVKKIPNVYQFNHPQHFT